MRLILFSSDAKLTLQALLLNGVNEKEASVHSGIQSAYDHVESNVLNAIKSQLASAPNYRVVMTGHSLGGALASLAAVSVKSALPNASVKLYTYGQSVVYLQFGGSANAAY